MRPLSFQEFNTLQGMASHLLEQAPASFSLAGHSMGGRVALEAYRQAPQRMVGRMSGEIYARQTQALLSRPDATPLLSEIRCPTLILCGQQDGWSPPQRHRQMAALIAGSKLRPIDDCGHLSTMEKPAEALSHLQAWMQWE